MNGVSTIELLVRMSVSLAVIGGLLWLIQQVGRKRLGGLGHSATTPIEISSRKQLSRTTSIALVRVGERNILIGVTDAGVNLIAEGDDLSNRTDLARKPDHGAQRSTHSGTRALDALREMTVRRA